MTKVRLSVCLLIFFSSVSFGLAQQIAAPSPGINTGAVLAGQLPGGKISLDIKGMDVVDVLKMFSSRSGLNIIVGKNVTGRVTLFLKDVDLWDAFEIILLANDLAYEKQGEIINVMTQRDYELGHGERFQDKKEVKIIQLKYAKAPGIVVALNQIKSNLGKVIADEASNTIVIIDTASNIKQLEDFIIKADLPVVSKVYKLNYAQAEKISPKIQEALTKDRGSLKIDERTNTIVVMDYPEKLEQIDTIIKAFDEKTPQVLIDAQLIQVSPSDKLEMGLNWEYWIRKYFDIKANLAINTANTLLVGTATSTPAQPGQYTAIMDILRTIGDTKVLSSPRIMVLNNQEAKIHVGVKDAYITSTTSQSGTGTAVTSQSVNFVDTGIQLYVKPTINRDGFVTMKIKPEISDSVRTDIKSEGQVTQIPIVSTSEAETTVMVKDGVTIIIGGLRKDKREKTVRKIPLLGDIPGIGFLFRSTSDSLTKSDLVILLTPHIISGEHTYSDFSEIKPDAGAVAKMVDGNIVTEKIPGSSEVSAVSKIDDIREYRRVVTNKLNAMIAKFGHTDSGKGTVEVMFVIDAQGQLREEPRIISASNEGLVDATRAYIKQAAPFPPLPKDLQKPEESFHLVLEYK